MSANPTCPQCKTEVPAAVIAEGGIVVCVCGPLIYIVPMGEWYVRWLAIEAGANALAEADPELVMQIRNAQLASEN